MVAFNIKGIIGLAEIKKVMRTGDTIEFRGSTYKINVTKTGIYFGAGGSPRMSTKPRTFIDDGVFTGKFIPHGSVLIDTQSHYTFYVMVDVDPSNKIVRFYADDNEWRSANIPVSDVARHAVEMTGESAVLYWKGFEITDVDDFIIELDLSDPLLRKILPLSAFANKRWQIRARYFVHKTLLIELRQTGKNARLQKMLYIYDSAVEKIISLPAGDHLMNYNDGGKMFSDRYVQSNDNISIDDEFDERILTDNARMVAQVLRVFDAELDDDPMEHVTKRVHFLESKKGGARRMLESMHDVMERIPRSGVIQAVAPPIAFDIALSKHEWKKLTSYIKEEEGVRVTDVPTKARSTERGDAKPVSPPPRAPKPASKACPPGKVLNAKTGRCIDKSGKLAKKLGLV